MSSVLAIVSRAVFEQMTRGSGRIAEGTVLGIDRYTSANRGLDPLRDGGSLFLVTVRAPDERLWLVAVLDRPTFDGEKWTGAESTIPIVDITALLPKLVFSTGKGVSAKKGALGMSLQTPRTLTEADEQLLRSALGKPVAAKSAGSAKSTKGSPSSKSASRAAAPEPPRGDACAGADLMSALQRASQAAGLGNARGALEALLGAWRLQRAPELAEAIEEVTATALAATPAPGASFEEMARSGDPLHAGVLVDRLREVPAAAALPRAALLKPWPADPRIAAAVMRLLADPPFHATGSQGFWNVVFQLLDTSHDPRWRKQLARLPKALEKVIHGASMRGWMQGKIQKAEAALAARPVVPALPAGAAALLETIRRARLAAAPARQPGGAVDEEALLRAVYDSPDDDAPRAVLSDFLLERGDPRGEFIQLQLTRCQRGLNPEEQRREAALLRKHQATWLGTVAPALEYKNYQRLGPEPPPGQGDQYEHDLFIRWHRGFLTGCMLKTTLPVLKKLASLPLWATLERVDGLALSAESWREPMDELLRNLRSLRRTRWVRLPVLKLLAEHPALVGQLEQIDYLVLSEGELAHALPLLESMPRLRRLSVYEALTTAEERALAASKLTRRLETLELCYDERDLVKGS